MMIADSSTSSNITIKDVVFGVAIALLLVTSGILIGFTVHFQHSLNQLQEQVDQDNEQVIRLQAQVNKGILFILCAI